MSQKPSGYERIDGDKYYTPAWVTDALLSVERFDGPGVYDPAAGAGHILQSASKAGYLVWGDDIAPDGPPSIGTHDFLTATSLDAHIITNPPYGLQGRLAVKFIEHALRLTQPAHTKVAMLLRVDFDSANGRRHIFNDHPAFAAKYALTRRIRWANIEQGKAGPTENHMWAVWDWARRRDGARVYGYLP